MAWQSVVFVIDDEHNSHSDGFTGAAEKHLDCRHGLKDRRPSPFRTTTNNITNNNNATTNNTTTNSTTLFPAIDEEVFVKYGATSFKTFVD